MNKQTSHIKKVDDTLVDQIGTKFSAAKDYVEGQVETVTDLYEIGRDKSKTLIRDARSNIKKYPLAAIGIAMLGGLILGRIFKRD